MIAYRLLYVGRRAQDPLLAAADIYLQRLGRYVQVVQHCVRDCGDSKAEASGLLKALDRTSTHAVYILDECGITPTTAQLAQRLDAHVERGQTHLTFVLGGAGGLHPSVKARAQTILSLSPMTLPHRLARVVLAEQLYRAHSILRGEPYHRGE